VQILDNIFILGIIYPTYPIKERLIQIFHLQKDFMMKKLFSPRNILTLSLTAALLLVSAVFVPQASAAGGSFNLMVEHTINGKDLGLDKALPVNVYLNGNLAIPDFQVGESISTSLPAGTYTVNVTLPDGTPLPSMDLGPVTIPAGVDVMIKAVLNSSGTPILRVDVAESAPAINTFDVTVKHSINGRSLGLPKALPVNVYINGALAILGFEFGDKVTTKLASGTYTITVELLDGTPLPSMTVGPVFVDADADLVFNAKLEAGTPSIRVLAR
jgi:CRISPR/Cas system-associated exonuclease Cas4 (RecB family)